MASKRDYGSGRLYKRGKREDVWYGSWWAGSQRYNRKIGAVRKDGTRDGLTKTQAQARLRKMMGETEKAPALSERLTLADARLLYVKSRVRKNRAPSTIKEIDSHFDCWIEPFLGHKPLDKINTDDVNDLIELMLSGDTPASIVRVRRIGRPLEPKTIRNIIGNLSAMFNYGLRKRWVTHNPCSDADLPDADGDEGVIRFLTPVEVEALAAAALKTPYESLDRTMFITAALTGLRQGELCALRWRDIDWTASRLRVRQNYVLGEFKATKGKKPRSVPLADRVATALELHYGQSAFREDDDLVFGDPDTGLPISKGTILYRFRQALRGARLDTSHVFHDLRHTFGTQMAAVGTPMRTLQEWMGHQHAGTTAIYAAYAPSAQEAKLINAAFGHESEDETEDDVDTLRARVRELERALGAVSP